MYTSVFEIEWGFQIDKDEIWRSHLQFYTHYSELNLPMVEYCFVVGHQQVVWRPGWSPMFTAKTLIYQIIIPW